MIIKVMGIIDVIAMLSDQEKKTESFEEALHHLPPYEINYKEFLSVQDKFKAYGFNLLEGNLELVEWFKRARNPEVMYEKWRILVQKTIDDASVDQEIRRILVLME